MTQRWTTSDFDALSWHDCHVHGLRLADANENEGTAELELDLDFILQWLPQHDGSVRFSIAPATLIFHSVSSLRLSVDYACHGAGMTPFSLHGIEREVVVYANGYQSFVWRLPVNWPAGEITFQSPGFTQILRREPIIVGSQFLSTQERAGLSSTLNRNTDVM